MRMFLIQLALFGFSDAAGGNRSRLHCVHRPAVMEAIDQECESRGASWLSFYTDLHRNPELSLQEKESARKVAERFVAAGYEVTGGVGGHGVVGLLRNGPGPVVMIRGDMDALPVDEETELPFRSEVKVAGVDGRQVGVMHACGHDVHQTCLIGTAEVLAKLKSRWQGTVILLAQPAEEIGVGALAMIRDGLFERFPKPNVCISLHVAADQPAGEIGFTPGWASANVDSVDITVFGRGGHGSRPEATVDPIVVASHVVTALQTIVSRRVAPGEPAVVTVGSIHAGSKHNIISDQATMQLTVRSYSDATRRLLLDSIRQVTINICKALGCEKEPQIGLRESEFTPAGFNDPQLTADAVKVFEEVVGVQNVVRQVPRMGGEDFGRYAKHLEVPGLMFWLGSVERGRYVASQKTNGTPLPSLHSSKYAPDAEPTIRTGVRCMTALALALLDTNP